MAATRSPPVIEAEPLSFLLDDHGAAPSITTDITALAIISGPSSHMSGPSSTQEQEEAGSQLLTPSGRGSEDGRQHRQQEGEDSVGVVAELDDSDDKGSRMWSRLEKGKAPEIAPAISSTNGLSNSGARTSDPVNGKPQPQTQPQITLAVGTTGPSSLAGLSKTATDEESSPISTIHLTPTSDSLQSLDAAASVPALKELSDQAHVTAPWKDKGKEKANAEVEAGSSSSSESYFNDDEDEDDFFDDDHFCDSDDDKKKAKGKGNSTNSGSGQTSAAGEGGPPVKQTLRFRDAVGRNFLLPWEKVRTYQGMQNIIHSACTNVYPVSQQVATKQYDLFVTLPISMDVAGNSSSTITTTTSGPSSSINTNIGTSQQQQQHQQPSSSFVVLPELWADMIEPGMLVTMSMRPPPPPPPHPPVMSPGYGRGRGHGRGAGVGAMGAGYMFPGPPGRGGGFTPGPPLPPHHPGMLHPGHPGSGSVPNIGNVHNKSRRHARSFRGRRGPG